MDERVEAPFDIEQIRLEAKKQWLSPSQICKILQNYVKFGITSKLPHKPPKQAVDSLISLGAAPGALTDRSPNYPSGRTPADLASVNGHKGIAGYLADCSLDVHIPSINLDHQDDAAGPEAVQKISERSAAALSLGNASYYQSLDFSTSARCSLILPNLEELSLLAHFDEIAAINEEDEGPDDEGPDDEGQDGEGPEKDKGLEKKKEERKKRAPDPALESGKACKILKAYLASMVLLTAYYNVQSMKTIQMLVLVFVEASIRPGERKLSYINDGFEPSAIRA